MLVYNKESIIAPNNIGTNLLRNFYFFINHEFLTSEKNNLKFLTSKKKKNFSDVFKNYTHGNYFFPWKPASACMRRHRLTLPTCFATPTWFDENHLTTWPPAPPTSSHVSPTIPCLLLPLRLLLPGTPDSSSSTSEQTDEFKRRGTSGAYFLPFAC